MKLYFHYSFSTCLLLVAMQALPAQEAAERLPAVQGLVGELRSLDPEQRRNARSRLQALPREHREAIYGVLAAVDGEVIPAMLLAMKDANPEVRYGAVSVLCDVNDKSRIPVAPLQKGLGDESGDVGSACAICLSQMGKRGVTALRAQLRNRNPRAREMAAYGLERAAVVGGPTGPAKEAVEDLVALLSDPKDEVRLQVVQSLRYIGEKAAGEPLANILKTEKCRAVRVEALSALLEMPSARLSPRALQAVAESLRRPIPDQSDLDNERVRAFRTINALAFESIEERSAAKSVLVQHGKESIPVLVPILKDKDWHLRTDVVETLAEIGCTTKYTIPALKELVAHEEPEARRHALSMLVRLLRNTHGILGKVKVRLPAAEARGILPEVKARLADPSRNVQIAAAAAGVEIEPKNRQAMGMLVKFVEDANEDIRIQAMKAVGELGIKARSEEMAAALARSLFHREPSVRGFAAHALGEIKEASVLTLLLEMAANDPEDSVRTAAENAARVLRIQ